MRKLVIAAAAIACAGLSGCVAYGGGPYGAVGYSDGYGYPYYSGGASVVIGSTPGYHHGYRGGYGYRDRDGDGVPNRYDSRPNNPRRY